MWELACFAITCRRTLHLSRDTLQNMKASLAAPWCYDRIACIGDRADVDDLPDAVLDAAGRSKLNAKIEAGNALGEYGGLCSQMPAVAQLYKGMESVRSDSVYWMSEADADMYLTVLSLWYPLRHNWVLFNVSKKLCVRASALAELAGVSSMA